MKRIITILLITLVLSGCSLFQDYKKYINTDYKSEYNWKAQGELLGNKNYYPDLSTNEKALKLMEWLTYENEPFTVLTKYYKIESLWIFHEGEMIWPPYEYMIKKFETLEFLEEKEINYPAEEKEME